MNSLYLKGKFIRLKFELILGTHFCDCRTTIIRESRLTPKLINVVLDMLKDFNKKNNQETIVAITTAVVYLQMQRPIISGKHFLMCSMQITIVKEES